MNPMTQSAETSAADFSDGDLDAIMAALPVAWPIIEQFAIESEEDDPQLAAGMAEQAATMRLLYDRLLNAKNYEYRIMVCAPGKRKWDHQQTVGASGRDPVRLRTKIERERERSPGWRFKIQRQKVIRIKCTWEDWEPPQFDGTTAPTD